MRDIDLVEKSYRIAQRGASQELIESLVNHPRWAKDRTRQTICFAAVWSRVFRDTDDVTLVAAVAADALGIMRDDRDTVYDTVLEVNQFLHFICDEDEEFIFDQDTGGLSEKARWDLEIIAEHLQKGLPGFFLPTTEPVETHKPEHSTGTKLINSRKSCQLEKRKPLFYEAVNAMQAQGYRLNPDMTQLKGLNIAFDPAKNYLARHNAVTTWDCFKNEFFFRYTFDYRGRAYARSLLLQPQGDAFSKAFLDLGAKKPLGKYGYNALAIHFANTAGHDKLSFADRIRWAKTDGLELAKSMAAARWNWTRIRVALGNKDNFEAYTSGMDFLRATLSGNPAAYESQLVCHQDATNSGFQFGAALTGDRETAELVNITRTLSKLDLPADIYGVMADTLKDMIQLHPNLHDWLPVIDRKFCKKPIMTTGYGAGIKTVMERLGEYMQELSAHATEYMHLVQRTPELEDFVLSALEETAGTMLHITEVMQAHAEEISSFKEEIEWITPDGFLVHQRKRDRGDSRIEFTANDKVVAMHVDEPELESLDSSGMITALSPNFIHSMDAQMLRSAAIDAYHGAIAFTPIHDSFGTHAATFFELHSLLKKAFVRTMSYPWYDQFCKHNNVKPMLKRLGDYQASEANEAVYIFS